MAWPNDFGTIPTNASGTTLLADATDDHALAHRQLGSIVNSVGTKLGLTSGTPAANQILVGSGGGTSGWNGEWDSGTLGTAVIKAPTINGLGTNSGTISGGVYTGGTVKGAQITTNYLGSVSISPGTSTTGTLDLSLGNRFLVNMPNAAGSVTLAVTNPISNQPFLVEILQAASGLGTINWFSTIRWSGSASPVQTLTASRKDTFGFITTGTAPTFDGYTVGQNI